MTYPEVKRFLEHHVLSDLSTIPEGMCSYIAPIANEWLSKEVVRGVLKDLRAVGLVKYERGLFADDGATAGAGYSITKEGREYYENL